MGKGMVFYLSVKVKHWHCFMLSFAGAILMMLVRAARDFGRNIMNMKMNMIYMENKYNSMMQFMVFNFVYGYIGPPH